MGVQKIINFDLLTASSGFLTISQGNFKFFIFFRFLFDFSNTKTFFANFLCLIFLNKEEPKSPQPK